MESATNYRPLIAAGVLLGIGLGGFVDGIVFHQILQWHGMVTHYYPKTGVPPEVIIRNMQINMFWDGLFHSVTWLSTVSGLALLWRAGRCADVPWSGRAFAGSLPLGWGIFNFVEGVIDHHILHVHHVTEEAGHLAWDVGFLGSGVVLIVLGIVLIRTAKNGQRSRLSDSPSRLKRVRAMVQGPFDDPRVALASERTLLAWVRTALAMMGFGFVVARFGLFLREIAAASHGTHPVPSGGMSMWFGTGLVILGAVAAVLAAAQHVRFLDKLERGEPYRPSRWSLGVLVAGVVTLIGGLMAGYLVLMRN